MKTLIGLQDVCARCRNKLLTFLVLGSFYLKYPSHLNSSQLFSAAFNVLMLFAALLIYSLLFSALLSASCLFFSFQLFSSPSQLQATTHTKKYVFQGIPTQKYYVGRISDIPSGNKIMYLFWYVIWYLFGIYIYIYK